MEEEEKASLLRSNVEKTTSTEKTEKRRRRRKAQGGFSFYTCCELTYFFVKYPLLIALVIWWGFELSKYGEGDDFMYILTGAHRSMPPACVVLFHALRYMFIFFLLSILVEAVCDVVMLCACRRKGPYSEEAEFDDFSGRVGCRTCIDVLRAGVLSWATMVVLTVRWEQTKLHCESLYWTLFWSSVPIVAILILCCACIAGGLGICAGYAGYDEEAGVR
mmetsp:Transcript_53472/g.117364  ORF Transcript_53472/g.117364 Transcript_53472/m.117364 type:complete len:219 (-) Transcript_53472:129-785(-)